MADEAKRILIVEDEAIVAIDTQAQLESLGYEVVAYVATAADARRAVGQLKPDLVLMDIRLGQLEADDGIAAAEGIYSEFRVPIVFLTAFGDRGTIARAREVGAYGYLVKPFKQQELHTTIEMALAKARADGRVRQRHDDLLAILDSQRQGTLAIDSAGKVFFSSQAAEKMLAVERSEAIGQSWSTLLPCDFNQRQQIENLLRLPAVERETLTLRLPPDRASATVIELEIADDPRDLKRRFLFLYDVSQLYNLRRLLDENARFEDLIGKSEPMQDVFQLIEEVAPVNCNVLIEGETGTGKELAARAIHGRSARKANKFLALNCAGLGDELAFSQLFGHRRGAFTGAVDDQPGMFEAASGGTLFLDEIGELPLRVQTMLLRVLEEKAIRRLGESELRPVDVRLIAATNRSLAEEENRGQFRADLLYRLRVCRIVLPPLRQRREDIPLLARQFLAENAAAIGKPIERISDDTMSVLLTHDWPGNVRELKNSLEFAVIRAKGHEVQPHDLPDEVLDMAASSGLLDDFTPDERGRIVAALKQAGGNRKEAAKLLGISRATLYRRLDSLGIGGNV